MTTLVLLAALCRLAIGIVLGVIAFRNGDRRSVAELGVALLLFETVKDVR